MTGSVTSAFPQGLSEVARSLPASAVEDVPHTTTYGIVWREGDVPVSDREDGAAAARVQVGRRGGAQPVPERSTRRVDRRFKSGIISTEHMNGRQFG